MAFPPGYASRRLIRANPVARAAAAYRQNTPNPVHGEYVARARQQLRDLVSDLLAAGAQAGVVRTDIAPGELASYCLHALTGAGSLPSEAAVRRLLGVT